MKSFNPNSKDLHSSIMDMTMSGGDIRDCILDFEAFGAEIKIDGIDKLVHPSGTWQVFGMTVEETLKGLFEQMSASRRLMDALEGKTFKIAGVKGKFTLYYCYLHYYFAKGSIKSVKECLESMKAV